MDKHKNLLSKILGIGFIISMLTMSGCASIHTNNTELIRTGNQTDGYVWSNRTFPPMGPVDGKNEWSTLDYTLMAGFVVGQVIDARQTIAGIEDPRYKELNPIIGQHKDRVVPVVIVTTGIVGYLAHVVGPRYRPWLLGLFDTVKGICIVNNYRYVEFGFNHNIGD